MSTQYNCRTLLDWCAGFRVPCAMFKLACSTRVCPAPLRRMRGAMERKGPLMRRNYSVVRGLRGPLPAEPMGFPEGECRWVSVLTDHSNSAAYFVVCETCSAGVA